MTSLNIPQHIIQSIGWTLVHSLWQGLLIFALLKVAVKLVPPTRSDVRYGLGGSALVLVVVCAMATFFALDNTPTTQQAFQFMTASVSSGADQISETSVSFITTTLQWIDANIIWLFRFWMLGFVVGLLRIVAGLLYIGRLRRNAHPVQDEWMHMVNSLSETLNIKRVVAMTEAGITSPMVVGFMKPMILFPFGLLAGLTPEQVETILIHELSHIRRQDYIINLFQAIVETIFFFNPFVILISSLIREERENCCDDMVIAKGISPITYVRTLAQLDASRSSSTLALGISGNKNQLLNRIKRIMENSAKNDWGKGRLVPVALVFLGLICASWLSIGSEADAKVSDNNKHNVLAADTSKEGLKVIKSRKNRSHFNEPTEPVAPVEDIPAIEFVPSPDFDSDFEPGYVPMPGMAIEIPEIGEIPYVELDGLGVLEDLEALKELQHEAPMAYGFNFDEFWGSDSIPGFRYQGNPEDWEQFEKEFTKKFKEQFKDFYDKNQDKIGKMMDEMRKEQRDAAEVVDLENMRRRASADAYRWKELEGQLWQLQNMPNADVIYAPKMIAPGSYKVSEDAARIQEKLAQMESLKAMQFDEQFRNQDRQFKMMNEKMREENDFLRDVARNAEEYKNELVKLMREDGYVNKNDTFSEFNINDDNGEMTINGKKIKEKDQVKYRALHDKYFAPRYKREGYSKPE